MILQGSRAPRAVSILLWSTPSTQNNQVFENSRTCTIQHINKILSLPWSCGISRKLKKKMNGWNQSQWCETYELLDWLCQKHSYLQAHVDSFIIVVQLKDGDTWVDLGTKFVLNVFLHTEVISVEIITKPLFVSEVIWGQKLKKKQPHGHHFFHFKVRLSWLYHRLDSFVTINCIAATVG